jgi:hypothetical protein
MNKLAIRNQIKGLLNRNDLTDTQADLFIDQAVARIQRTLRVPSMEKTQIYTTGVDGGNLLVLPNDFLQLKHLYTENSTIVYSDLGNFVRTVDTPGYAPRIYTRVQGSFQIKPTPPVGYEIYMVYYGEIPDLVTDTDSNFLTEIAPDLLVYASLTFAADFFIDERKDAFETIAVRIFNELKDQATDMEWAQEGMSIATAYNAPEY